MKKTKNKTCEKEFKKEIELLKNQLGTDELLVLGQLKGFTRNHLQMMIHQLPILPKI